MSSLSRLEKVPSRAGADLRDAIENLPGLGGIALWVNYVDTDDADCVAATDGNSILIGPCYAHYTDAERRFILLHELLHVALAHPARSLSLAVRREGFDLRLYNVACDAIVNAALSGTRGTQMPQDAVKLEKILEALDLKGEQMSAAEEVRRWSSETLYYELEKRRESLKEELCAGVRSDIIPLTDNASPSDRQPDETIRIWNSRLAMARGSLAGIMGQLAKEIPQVKTPWERTLRDYLHRYARRRHKPDPTRPTRRWLALEGLMRQNENVDLPFERSRRAGRTGRLVVAFDTSGSIDDPILARFVGELCAIIEQLEPMVRLIVADAEVHQTIDLAGAEAVRELRRIEFKGGGGTDFRPAIEAAADWKPDLLIYLTDLMGEAGEEPIFPVLWAVPAGHAAAPAWGRIIELD